jgi:hypothetical protein
LVAGSNGTNLVTSIRSASLLGEAAAARTAASTGSWRSARPLP